MEGTNRHIFRAVLTLGLLIAGNGVMCGATYYQARMTVNVAVGQTGMGTAYIDGNPSITTQLKGEDNTTGESKYTYNINASPKDGYHFVKWDVSKGKGSFTINGNNESTTVEVTAAKSGNYDKEDTDDNYRYTNEYTATASFAENYYVQVKAETNDIDWGKAYVKYGTAVFSDSDTSTEAQNDNGNAAYNELEEFAIKAVPVTGYHFTVWETNASASDVEIVKSTPSTTFKVKTKEDKQGIGTPAVYTIKALFAENFYTKLTASKGDGGKSDPTVSPSEYQNAPVSNQSLTYTVTAGAPNDGYHFVKWTVENGSPSSSTDNPLTVTVLPASTGGKDHATHCIVTASYEQNVYWAKLVAQSAGNGTASVEESQISTNSSGGDVTFHIGATADPGYHFVNWTTNGAGGFENAESSNTTFTAQASTEYDQDKATSYTVTAHFEKDQFNAKLTTAVSSKSDVSSSTAQVSSDDGTNWSNEETKTSESSGGDVTFKVKAEPAQGFKFVGWSTTDGSEDFVPGLGAVGDYTVKSHTTQGETKEYQLYAVFKKEYSIKISAESAEVTSGTKIVFNVAGPENYRVSVPVGGSITLKDVPEGEYTVTPESGWNWIYEVSPTSSSTTVNAFDGVNLSKHTFTVQSKDNVKSHSETSTTKEY